MAEGRIRVTGITGGKKDRQKRTDPNESKIFVKFKPLQAVRKLWNGDKKQRKSQYNTDEGNEAERPITVTVKGAYDRIVTIPDHQKKGSEAQQTINVTGVTGGNVDTVITAGIVHGWITINVHEQREKLLERTKDEIEVMTAGMMRVSAVDEVVNKMNTGQHWITITGNAGDGKTTLGYLVLKEFLQKNVKVFTIDKPEEYDHIAGMEEDRVIMFDDGFGAFLADHQLIKRWRDVIQNILRLSKRDKPKTHVLFISRVNVLKESKVYLGHLSDDMFDENCVDLSYRNVTDERLKILDYHLGRENVTISDDIKRKVCNMQMAFGFPYCCKMFSKLKSMGYNLSIEEFFTSPLKFLDMTTKVLYFDNCRSLFKLMIENDGQLDINAIEDDEKRQCLLQVGKDQEGSYVTMWRNGIFCFANPSVYGSVLNVINEVDPLYCVQYATLSIIRQKMLIPTSDEDDSSRSLCNITVKTIPAVLTTLATRFREEILKGDYSVFKHRLCQSIEFCESLVSCCVHTGEEENDSKRFIDQPGQNGETIFSTALNSGQMTAVRVLVKAGADVNIQDQRGKTPMHYLWCSQSSAVDDDCYSRMSDVKKYDYHFGSGSDDEENRVDIATLQIIITEGGGDVNIQDGTGRTPLHYLFQDINSIDTSGADDQHLVAFDALQVLITEGGGDVNIQDSTGRTPLHYLFQSMNSTASFAPGDQHLVAYDTLRVLIIEGGGDVNICDKNGQTPLHFLSQVNKSITTAGDDDDGVDDDADDDDDDDDAYDQYIMALWPEGNGDLKRREQNKIIPMHLLAYSDMDMLDLLINEGKGDFNKGDQHGTTPLHYLCDIVECDVVFRILSTANGDINKQDDNGITPLHVLCKGPQKVKYILELISEGDKSDMFGNTPIHYLCRRRGINSHKLQHQLKQIPKRNMMKRNALGYTPLDYLTDLDDCLPWEDGIVYYSSVDKGSLRSYYGTQLRQRTSHLPDEDSGRLLTNIE